MVVYVSFGGMRATTWIQIVKAVLLMGGAIALTVLVLVRFHGDCRTSCCARRPNAAGTGRTFLAPGLKYGGDWTARLDFISLGLALVLGTAGLPHILSRFYTVPTARAARRSVVWSIGLIGGFYLMTIVLGFGAAAVLGPEAVRGSNAAGNTAVPLLALDLGRRRGLHRRNGSVRGGRRDRLRHDPRGGRRHHPGLLGLRRPRPVRLAAAPARQAAQRGRPWRGPPRSGSVPWRSPSVCWPGT